LSGSGLTSDPHPILVPGEVHIWQVLLDIAPDKSANLENILSPDERERAQRFHFERDRHRYIAGRGALRSILARYLGRRPDVFAFLYGKHGKPALPETTVQFNLAHSGGLAVLALSHGASVGVDVEEIRAVHDWDGVMNRFFAPAERAGIMALPPADRLLAFFSCWTRKEAYLKATGTGIGISLDSFDVSVDPGSKPRLLRVEENPQEARRWHFQELSLGAKHVGVVALEGPILRVWQFTWTEA
jgi:4'-phosphopantetheinyl transferase